LRARPDPIQSEHLSDASFLDELLVLPANGRLDWKVIAGYKHSSLIGLVDSDEAKNVFVAWTPGFCVDVDLLFNRLGHVLVDPKPSTNLGS
jgi:hypothetical protein